jgi:hypothetical protein
MSMPLEPFLQQYRGELTILVLGALLVLSLLILVPQLLRAHQKALELQHQQNMRSLEQGLPLASLDERSLFAGRTALLVPIVSICTAGTVTCFLVAYRSEWMFSVTVVVWIVAGVVSLAAITGCVALFGRLAQLQAGAREDEPPHNPLEK